MRSSTFVTSTALMSLAACQEEAGPSEVYLAYHAKVAEGRSFEDDAAHFSAARQAEIEARLAGLSADAREAQQATYLDFTGKLAAYHELTLDEERVAEGRADLVFTITDRCDNQGKRVGRELVSMIDEDGWKIVETETSFED